MPTYRSSCRSQCRSTHIVETDKAHKHPSRCRCVHLFVREDLESGCRHVRDVRRDQKRRLDQRPAAIFKQRKFAVFCRTVSDRTQQKTVNSAHSAARAAGTASRCQTGSTTHSRKDVRLCSVAPWTQVNRRLTSQTESGIPPWSSRRSQPQGGPDR